MKRFLVLTLFFWASFAGMGIAECASGIIPDAASSAAPPDYSDTLFGDWGGMRGRMSARGYDPEIIYKLDLLGKSSASQHRIYGLDNLDIKLSLDGDKIAGIRGSSGLLYILSNHGGKPALKEDRLPNGVDNIETPENANTTKLYQAWIQQAFPDEGLSVLIGLYDLNSEFYVTDSSSMFILPAFGIGSEMGGTGKNGPSIFPTTSFAIRIKAENAAGYYLQAATLDGVPGDPGNPRGTHVQFNKGDGALNVIEGGIPLGVAMDGSDLALGVWRYTSRFDDLLDVDSYGNPVRRISHGYYAMLEKVLRYKPGSDGKSIEGFMRAGKTDGDTSQVDMSWSTGLVFTGLVAGRDYDELGFAFAQARNGEKYRIASGDTVTDQKTFELTYRYRARPGLVLQPVVQYLLDNGNGPAQGKTWWLGTRLKAEF